MPKNEEGEFELILGNRQLLSVFFIVVVLLGVFFTMGYIVGRNSPLATADAAPDKKPARQIIDSAAPHDTPAPVTPSREEQAKDSTPAPVPTETAPQQPETKPEPVAKKPEPVVAKKSRQAEPAKVEAKKKPEPPSPEPRWRSCSRQWTVPAARIFNWPRRPNVRPISKWTCCARARDSPRCAAEIPEETGRDYVSRHWWGQRP